jgi:hypothetical protein
MPLRRLEMKSPKGRPPEGVTEFLYDHLPTQAEVVTGFQMTTHKTAVSTWLRFLVP